MATLLNNTISTPTLVGNQNIVYSNSGSSWSDVSLSLNSDLTEFFELVLAALGYDITFENFKKMSSSERNQLIRDIKLKTII
jgi:hypothetical protein